MPKPISELAQEKALWLMEAVVEYTALMCEVREARSIGEHDQAMDRLVQHYVSVVEELKTFAVELVE